MTVERFCNEWEAACSSMRRRTVIQEKKTIPIVRKHKPYDKLDLWIRIMSYRVESWETKRRWLAEKAKGRAATH